MWGQGAVPVAGGTHCSGRKADLLASLSGDRGPAFRYEDDPKAPPIEPLVKEDGEKVRPEDVRAKMREATSASALALPRRCVLDGWNPLPGMSLPNLACRS